MFRRFSAPGRKRCAGIRFFARPFMVRDYASLCKLFIEMCTCPGESKIGAAPRLSSKPSDGRSFSRRIALPACRSRMRRPCVSPSCVFPRTSGNLCGAFRRCCSTVGPGPLSIAMRVAFTRLLSQGLAPQLEPGRNYRSYIDWLGKQQPDEAQAFWREYLAGFKAPTAFPTEMPEANGHHAGVGGSYLEYGVDLSPEATNALNAAARGLRITLGTLLLAAWSLELDRQSGAGEIVFGAAFSGRPADLRGVESIIGPFVNNLPVRVAVNGEAKLGEFLADIHAQSMKLSAHQFTPLMEIQACSEVPWKHRLFDSVVVFQNYLVDESARRFGSEIGVADFVGPIHTNYPVMFLIEPGDSLRFTLIYDSRLIARRAIERWARDLAVLLEKMPQMLGSRVADLQGLLSPPAIAPVRAKLRLQAESQNFVPPQTEMERAISGVWQGLFGLDRISVEDNFFDLGGHSLLLVQMHNRLRETLRTEFPVVTLFEYPTVRLLARYLDKSEVPAGGWRR